MTQNLSRSSNFDQFSIVSEISELQGRLEASSVIVSQINSFFLAKYI